MTNVAPRVSNVMKFGGSSLATPERIRAACAVVQKSPGRRRIVVVSALQGVTNQLLDAARSAERGSAEFRARHDALARRHRDALAELHGGRAPAAATQELEAMLAELRDSLQGIFLLRQATPRALDLAASFGERMSAVIFTSCLRKRHPAVWVDSREIVRTDDRFTRAGVLFEKTNHAIRERFRSIYAKNPANIIPVVTGFLGSTEDGRTTTIGRNGSDYSAAIIGAALHARVIEIWTDVDGVLSADPAVVPAAFVIPRMSYEEAMEMSYFGAKVLHASTIAPAIAERIPIRIKNSLNPSAPGTLISDETGKWVGVAKGISAVDDCTLLTLRGMSMVGVPGTAERLFHALGSQGVSVILISQASSEHTICFAIRASDVPAARRAVESEFRRELRSKLTSLDENPGQTIVAVVGDGMKGMPGVSGRIFQSLGRNNVNVSAIAQGASERNVSLVVDTRQATRALNVIHEAFFESKRKLGVILIGVGNIGGTLLRQIHHQRAFLDSLGFEVRICAIANSKRFLIQPSGIDTGTWRESLQRSGRRMVSNDFLRAIGDLDLTNGVIVDCTASSHIVDLYEDFIRMNLHIVTPNKKANVLPWRRYKRMTDLMRSRQKYFLYEANVGAGLPIISTLNDLIASGDQIVRVEGIFSGTLSHLFNQYNGEQPFSTLVQEALELGYTEPDPREDLSGRDVARKLLILARQIGLKMELSGIRVQNLVPRFLQKGKLGINFFARYATHDGAMKKRFEAARKHGAVLRYVGILEGNAAQAGIREIPENHLFATAKGSDNVIAFTTHRYARTPLVVQGPGAGADVAAMGVFYALLNLLHNLPH